MSGERFIEQQGKAADNIANMPRHELQVLLRRAAIRLRNPPAAPVDDGFDPDADFQSLIDAMNKPA